MCSKKVEITYKDFIVVGIMKRGNCPSYDWSHFVGFKEQIDIVCPAFEI